MSKKHALITGGAGFIGSHIADTLLAQGYEVTVIDCMLDQVHADGELDADGWPTYLNPAVHRIRGNLLAPGLFKRALRGKTHLVHMAASVGVGQSMTNIMDYTRNNVMVAATILEALNDRSAHQIERIAVASSMSIYGEGLYRTKWRRTEERVKPRTHAQLEAREWEPQDGVGNPFEPIPTTEDKPLAPSSIYAIGKRDHEEMFLSMGYAWQIPTVALRLFNAYGSRQALSNPYTGVAAIFINRLLNDQAPMVFEDGEQMRDFVHVQDVADAFATVLNDDRPIWDAFNVGSGRPVTVNYIAQLLARLLHKNIAPEITNRFRVGDIRHCFADIGKIERIFGWKPKRTFESGMPELIDWVRIAPKPVDRTREAAAELQNLKMVV
jgi:dTDP-L-rhamnose 4-epimerase